MSSLIFLCRNVLTFLQYCKILTRCTSVFPTINGPYLVYIAVFTTCWVHQSCISHSTRLACSRSGDWSLPRIKWLIPAQDQTNYYQTCICCFSLKQTSLKNENKVCTACPCGVTCLSVNMFQWASTMKIHPSIWV